MRCIWCGRYFCEDCADPHKHSCPTYREGVKHTVYTKHGTDYSLEGYEKFPHTDLGEEPMPELSVEEKEAHNREHIIKANLIYQERLRLGVGRFPNQCPICGSAMNRIDEKCILCGIEFCVYCVKPEKHKCVMYRYEMGKYTVKSPEIVAEPVIASKVIVEPVMIPEVVAEPTKIDEPLSAPEVQAAIMDSKEIDVKEEIKVKKKIPLWRKILFLLGFGKHSVL